MKTIDLVNKHLHNSPRFAGIPVFTIESNSSKAMLACLRLKMAT